MKQDEAGTNSRLLETLTAHDKTVKPVRYAWFGPTSKTVSCVVLHHLHQLSTEMEIQLCQQNPLWYEIVAIFPQKTVHPTIIIPRKK